MLGLDESFVIILLVIVGLSILIGFIALSVDFPLFKNAAMITPAAVYTCDPYGY
jgi:hypothetical protein